MSSVLLEPEIHLYDFDTVSEDNLIRQNFVPADIGKNKAEVLAERYTRAYGIPIQACNVKIETAKTLLDIFDGGITRAMVILCVDNVVARKHIVAALAQRTTSKYLIIDAGNEADFGQVTIFSNKFFCAAPFEVRTKTGELSANERIYLEARAENSEIQSIKGKFKQETVGFLVDNSPVMTQISAIPLDFFEYFSQTDTAAQSCAGLSQTLAINHMMASGILSIVQRFYHGLPFTFNRLCFSLDGGNKTDYMTEFWLRSMLEEPNTAPSRFAEKYRKTMEYLKSMPKGVDQSYDSRALYSTNAITLLNSAKNNYDNWLSRDKVLAA
jgi:hypothetical protein